MEGRIREKQHCHCHNCYCQCQIPHHDEDEEANSNSSGEIILGVSVHCDGCEYAILKSLRGFDGVESVKIDSEKNIVRVKGKGADPITVTERLRKKTGKTVQLISPKLPKVKEVGKKKELPMVEVSLKVYLDCDGCMINVRCCLHKFPGVQNVQLDKEKNLVVVKGTVEAKKLVIFLKESTGKHVEIVKQDTTKNDDTTPNSVCCHPCDLVYAPQLFSDENPNACCVM